MDPYAQYHQEISAAIISLATLHQSYNRLLSTTPPPQHSSSQPISYALAELRATITALQLDLEELDESVEALEKDPEIARRLGLGGEVVRERREFVDSINRRVNVGFLRSEDGNVVAHHLRFWWCVGYTKDPADDRLSQ